MNILLLLPLFAPLFEDPAPTMDIAAAVAALTTLGVLPVITTAAVVGIAATLYRRFRH